MWPTSLGSFRQAYREALQSEPHVTTTVLPSQRFWRSIVQLETEPGLVAGSLLVAEWRPAYRQVWRSG